MRIIPSPYRIFATVLILLIAGIANAKIDKCQPDGMSDDEAERIIAIATEQGKAFRAKIDALRASGVSYETDTTYDDLMADPERVLALAKVRHFGRETSLYGNSPKVLRELNTTLDWLFENRIGYWIKKQNLNFFTTELTSHLQQLAIQLGGEPTKSPYRYKINTKTFIFALGHFTKGAELKYLVGVSENRVKYTSIRNRFSEKWALYGRKPNFEILIFLTANPAGGDVTLDYISFGWVDWLKGSSPIFLRGNEGCLATFTQVEE